MCDTKISISKFLTQQQMKNDEDSFILCLRVAMQYTMVTVFKNHTKVSFPFLHHLNPNTFGAKIQIPFAFFARFACKVGKMRLFE